MTDREFAVDVVRRLRQSGYEAYWAGGCVRDELLNLVPADYDVATSARPEDVVKTFKKTVEVGVSFGVVEVIGPRRPDGSFPKVQVATFRSDGAYVDGRRPESVTFSSPREDAERRDFTINGMFLDPLDGRVIDYVGGQADLQAKVLRAIGDPKARFREDKLRLLRAVRMAARFGFPIEPQTAAAIREMASQITVVSAERIAEELRKILANPTRAWALRQMDDLGLLRHVLPEIENEMKGLPQGFPNAPTGDLWQHTLKVLEVLEGPQWPEPLSVSFQLAFAALLHDVGKKRSAAREADRYTFHGHEHIGKRLAGVACRRLKLSNAESDRVEWLVERHQYLCDAVTMRISKLKPILVHPGIGELLALHRADSVASGRSVAHVEFCERMLRDTPPEVLNPPPLLTGDDLIARGWEQGPLFKTVLDVVREAQLEGTIHTKDEAIALAEERKH
ncbi:MAG TPA: CCA tRNA nucleotidyltransferase [Gemmataceae bacterium]|nr:CCA tRNA nucleotidyltransferase [Gemmataceae bacterium]